MYTTTSNNRSNNPFSPPIGIGTGGHNNKHSHSSSQPTSTASSSIGIGIGIHTSVFSNVDNSSSMNFPKSFHELKQHQRHQPQQHQQQQQQQQMNPNAPFSSSLPSASNVTGAAAAAAGARLLSSRGIDTSSLFNKAKSLESRIQTNASRQSSAVRSLSMHNAHHTHTTPSAGAAAAGAAVNDQIHLQGTNIHSTLESIRLQTITNILSRQETNMKQTVQSKIQNRLVSDWNNTKEQIMRDTVILDQNGRRIMIGADGGGAGSKDANANVTNTGGGGDSSSQHHPSSLATSTFSVSNNPKELDEFHNLATYHHSTIFTDSYRTTRDTSVFTNSLLGLSHELSITNPMYNPYHNATKLVSTLSSTSAVAGGYHPQQSLSTSSSSSNRTDVKERTISSLLFLSNQFREYIVTKVKNSTSSTNTMTGGFMGFITKYVEMEIGHDQFMSGKKDVLFKCMYYSLRCGDVDAALKLYSSSRVSSSSSSGNSGTLKKVLEYLVQKSASSTSGSGGSSNTSSSNDQRCIGLFHGLNSLSSTYIAEMKDLYHHVVLNTTAGNNINLAGEDRSEYEIALLAMLSFSDVSSSDDGAGSVATTTIEDYIYLGLWNSLAPNCNVTDAVVSLGEGIKSYGSDYFEDSVGPNKASCGWAYAMPLLLCQCYKSGIVHLAQSGNGLGLCMGIHLALALTSHKRMMITDLVDELKMANEASLLEQNNFVMSTLLISYAKALQSNSPSMALEYLTHIPDTTMSRIPMKNGMSLSQKAEKQISNLLLETKAFSILAGQISPDGSRPASGALDVHFTPNGVSDLLSTAANDSSREGKISDAAELLSLAGRYSTLLSLLNRKLASLVVVTKEDGIGSEKQEQRNLWKDAAHRFYSMYLSQGHSQVIQILEAEGQLSLGKDFQLLLNLMVFFERCYEEDWKTAWELIADLDLLPTEEETINAVVESYHNLSDEIQQIFHHIIVKSMECLSNLHSYLKSSYPDSSPNVQNASEQHLLEIRNKAKILVTFAGFIRMNSANEVRTKIGKMEAYMI